MRLTEEQRNAVHCDDHLMLTACPGSGKTRVIISKLARTIDVVRGTPRAVACITYTNTAVHEIEARLRYHIQPGDDAHFDIGTIHAFCLNHIFRPFCHLVQGHERGFRVLTPDSAEFVDYVTRTCSDYNRHNLGFRDLEDFTQVRISIGGEPIGHALERGALTPAMAKSYWRRIRNDGFVDFANIIYLSYLLLKKRPEILRYISAKFAWILVDEFQDTTDLQVEILALIASAGRTTFLLVGDPCQSIFGFAGARPDLADDLVRRIAARTDLKLTGNFRSSPTITAHANRLYPRHPPMAAVGSAKVYRDVPRWEHGGSAINVITDSFLPALDALGIPIGDAAILAPTWFSLFPLGRRLREFGVSIVGPGARPYRRNRTFAPLAEHVCAYLLEPRPEAIGAAERSLFHTLQEATGRVNYGIFSYEGRVVLFRLLACARRLHHQHMGAIEWLEAAAAQFSSILIEEGYLSLREGGLFSASVADMKADMINNRIDVANLTLNELGVYAQPDAALKLSTLHNAKGREYQAVALIDLHEGRLPHFTARTHDEIEEGKRLFYVGVTRAKRFLLYVTDGSDHRNVPSRFLRAETGVAVA